MTLNIALIGAGRIGRVHAKALMTAIPNATILAVADYHLASATALADEYGIAFYTDNHMEAIQ